MSIIPLRVSTVVSTQWLADKLSRNTSNLRVLDSSWHMPFSKRNARQEFYRDHIPGAQFFDLDECSDKNSPYEHMLPGNELFEEYVGKLGINNNTHVILYDNNDNFGLFSAQRVWWTFRTFGHTLVSILDGGFPKWNREHYDTTDVVEYVEPQVFKARFDSTMVKSFEEMEKNLKDKSFQVVDARPAGRFEGTSPEPRPGVKPGHMPDAISLPFTQLLYKEAKVLKSAEDIRQAFQDVNVDWNKPLVFSCGSGVSACMLALGAHICGKMDTAVYDGSWMEWYKRAKFEHKVGTPV